MAFTFNRTLMGQYVGHWCGGKVVLGADSSFLVSYGVIHFSRGHIQAQVRVLGISRNPFICTFYFICTLWVACMLLENPSAYNMYLFNQLITNHILIKKRRILRPSKAFILMEQHITWP